MGSNLGMTDTHVILAGDSIFDNATYVPGEPCVTEQLSAVLGDRGTVNMVAVDGSFVEQVADQIRTLPADATHICVSTGGNDALKWLPKLHSHLLSDESPWKEWAEIQSDFRQSYRDMLQAVLAIGLPSAVCTIYDAVPIISALERAALSLFNDVIMSEAVSVGLPVVDLRLVCTEASDYSPLSPIEPSSAGGNKIARALAAALYEHDYSQRKATVYS